ncbi:MAG: MAPEG family protein [Alphaproteobacteria bacterium]
MTVTPLYAGLLGVFYIMLAALVIRTRFSARIALGSGGNELLERRIRAHGNFAEYAPLGIVLVGILDLMAISAYLLHFLGIALVAGRLLHAFSLSALTKRPAARIAGMLLTLTSVGVGSVVCLLQVAGV